MNPDSDTRTLARPIRTPATAGDGGTPSGAPSDAAQQAQQALDRSRRMNQQVSRLLGGLELEDARNVGGQ